MNDKKLNITLSALKIFQEKGIDNSTITDIVKDAGVAQGTFYLYFPSKSAIMPAIARIIIKELLDRLKTNINLNDHFHQQLTDFIKMNFEMTKEYKDTFALIYVGLASSGHLVNWEDIYDEYYEAVSNILATAQKNKSIKQSINTKRYGILLISLIESAAYQSYLYDKLDSRAIEIKKREVFDFALNGLIEEKVY